MNDPSRCVGGTDPGLRAAEPSASSDLAAKRGILGDTLRSMRSVAVAFSGGVDSAVLLHEAYRVLGANAVAYTAVSPSLAATEREIARRIAMSIGVEWVEVTTDELEDERYRRNDAQRCFYCKTHLFSVVRAAATARGLRHVADGNNIDDRGDYRPGRRAARDHGVRSPLMEAGLRKVDVREIARAVGLEVWDKPATPCLSSRIPYHSPVTDAKLRQIERAETILRDAGFDVARVRHHGDLARIEVPADRVPALCELPVRASIEAALRELGFAYVTVDLAGFASGRLNGALGRLAVSEGGPRKNAEQPPGRH